MTSLSADRKEFARLCVVEMKRASKLSGGKMPDQDWLAAMAEDMARSSALAKAPCSRVTELFAHSRAYYAEAPILRHLVKSWNALRPKAEPLPSDAPMLAPPPALDHSEAKMRKLAAVRTVLAERGQFGLAIDGRGLSVVTLVQASTRAIAKELDVEDWMVPLLQHDPSREEVAAMRKASTDSTLAFYRRMPDLPPCWGGWIAYYGI